MPRSRNSRSVSPQKTLDPQTAALLKEREKIFQNAQEMFHTALDADVIHMVLVECNWRGDEAIDKLLVIADDGEAKRQYKKKSQLQQIAEGVFGSLSSEDYRSPGPRGNNPLRPIPSSNLSDSARIIRRPVKQSGDTTPPTGTQESGLIARGPNTASGVSSPLHHLSQGASSDSGLNNVPQNSSKAGTFTDDIEMDLHFPRLPTKSSNHDNSSSSSSVSSQEARNQSSFKPSLISEAQSAYHQQYDDAVGAQKWEECKDMLSEHYVKSLAGGNTENTPIAKTSKQDGNTKLTKETPSEPFSQRVDSPALFCDDPAVLQAQKERGQRSETSRSFPVRLLSRSPETLQQEEASASTNDENTVTPETTSKPSRHSRVDSADLDETVLKCITEIHGDLVDQKDFLGISSGRQRSSSVPFSDEAENTEMGTPDHSQLLTPTPSNQPMTLPVMIGLSASAVEFVPRPKVNTKKETESGNGKATSSSGKKAKKTVTVKVSRSNSIEIQSGAANLPRSSPTVHMGSPTVHMGSPLAVSPVISPALSPPNPNTVNLTGSPMFITPKWSPVFRGMSTPPPPLQPTLLSSTTRYIRPQPPGQLPPPPGHLPQPPGVLPQPGFRMPTPGPAFPGNRILYSVPSPLFRLTGSNQMPPLRPPPLGMSDLEDRAVIATGQPILATSEKSQLVSQPPPVVYTGGNTVKLVNQPMMEQQLQKLKELHKSGKKVLVIVRGLPGSGKSTLSRALQMDGIVLSTDDYFMRGDRYDYHPDKLPESHQWNRERAKEVMKMGTSPIIIDNTNTQRWEFKPYVSMAHNHNYHVEIMEPSTPWKFKPKELARRTIHGVPKDHIQRMLSRYEHNITLEMLTTKKTTKTPNSTKITYPSTVPEGGPTPDPTSDGAVTDTDIEVTTPDSTDDTLYMPSIHGLSGTATSQESKPQGYGDLLVNVTPEETKGWESNPILPAQASSPRSVSSQASSTDRYAGASLSRGSSISTQNSRSASPYIDDFLHEGQSTDLHIAPRKPIKQIESDTDTISTQDDASFHSCNSEVHSNKSSKNVSPNTANAKLKSSKNTNLKGKGKTAKNLKHENDIKEAEAKLNCESLMFVNDMVEEYVKDKNLSEVDLNRKEEELKALLQFGPIESEDQIASAEILIGLKLHRGVVSDGEGEELEVDNEDSDLQDLTDLTVQETGSVCEIGVEPDEGCTDGHNCSPSTDNNNSELLDQVNDTIENYTVIDDNSSETKLVEKELVIEHCLTNSEKRKEKSSQNENSENKCSDETVVEQLSDTKSALVITSDQKDLSENVISCDTAVLNAVETEDLEAKYWNKVMSKYDSVVKHVDTVWNDAAGTVQQPWEEKQNIEVEKAEKDTKKSNDSELVKPQRKKRGRNNSSTKTSTSSSENSQEPLEINERIISATVADQDVELKKNQIVESEVSKHVEVEKMEEKDDTILKQENEINKVEINNQESDSIQKPLDSANNNNSNHEKETSSLKVPNGKKDKLSTNRITKKESKNQDKRNLGNGGVKENSESNDNVLNAQSLNGVKDSVKAVKVGEVSTDGHVKDNNCSIEKSTNSCKSEKQGICTDIIIKENTSLQLLKSSYLDITITEAPESSIIDTADEPLKTTDTTENICNDTKESNEKVVNVVEKQSDVNHCETKTLTSEMDTPNQASSTSVMDTTNQASSTFVKSCEVSSTSQMSPKSVSQKKGTRRKMAANFQGPLFNADDQVKFLNMDWKTYPLTSSTNPKVTSEPPNETIAMADHATMTDNEDFTALNTLSQGRFINHNIKVLTGHCRKLVPLKLDNSDNICSDKNVIVKVHMQDESTFTDDLQQLSDSESVNFLKTCFPEYPEDELECVLANCAENVEWAINLLLDWKYSLNLSNEEKQKFVDGMAQVQRVVSPVNVVPTIGIGDKQPTCLLDICFNKVEQENIATREEIEQQLIQTGKNRLDRIEDDNITKIRLRRSTSMSESSFNLSIEVGKVEYSRSVSVPDRLTDGKIEVYESDSEENLASDRTVGKMNDLGNSALIEDSKIDETKNEKVDEVHNKYSALNYSVFERKENPLTTDESMKSVSIKSGSVTKIENKKSSADNSLSPTHSTIPKLEPVMNGTGVDIVDYKSLRMERILDREMEREINQVEDIPDQTAMSLTLDPSVVVQLESLFGKIGRSKKDSCDVTVSLDHTTARLLYQCMKRGQTDNHRLREQLLADEELARKLQSSYEYESIVEKGNHSRQAGAWSKGATPLVGLSVKGTIPDIRRQVQKSGKPVKPLSEIMEEELTRQANQQDFHKLVESEGGHIALATRMKRQLLFEKFPDIDRTLLDEMFRKNCFNLSETEAAILEFLGEETPVLEVMSEEMVRDSEQKLLEATKKQSIQEMLDTYLYTPMVAKDYQDGRDPNYEDYRGEANLHYRLRHECFQKSQEAFRRGMKDLASFYSQQGHQHSQKIKEANMRASEQILQDRNVDLEKNLSLDLHGLHVDEAIAALDRVIPQKERERRSHLIIITGRGSHSRGGVARLRPSVLAYLQRHQYHFTETHSGVFKVALKYRTADR